MEKTTMEKKTFSSPLAGRWFPADPRELASDIQSYIDTASSEPLPDVIALILPHAGYVYSGRAAAAGLKTVQNKSFKRVIVMGPSHRAFLENAACVPDLTHFSTPLGEVALDQEFAEKLRSDEHFRAIPNVFEYEHSVQIEVPLLQKVLGTFALVPIVVGQVDAEAAQQMAQVLQQYIDQDTLVVVSSDFTHYGPNYGYMPFHDNEAENLKALDMGAFAFIKKKDATGFLGYIRETGATICGASPIAILLNMLPDNTSVRLVQYDTSGALMHDYTNSVSYLSIAVTGKWHKNGAETPSTQIAEKTEVLSEDDKRRLLELARKTLVYAFDHRETPTPEQLGIELTENMKQVMGAFVTIKKHGELRGCIGEIYPQRPLYQAVIAQALNAAFEDPRFPPVHKEELPDLTFEISAYAEGPKPVSSYNDIRLGIDGIVIEKQGRRALFLPQVAPEQGWDLPTTLEHLCRKAGLPTDAWKEGASFSTFQAIIFKESED